jgi:AcrR family transcriptional regulator
MRLQSAARRGVVHGQSISQQEQPVPKARTTASKSGRPTNTTASTGSNGSATRKARTVSATARKATTTRKSPAGGKTPAAGKTATRTIGAARKTGPGKTGPGKTGTRAAGKAAKPRRTRSQATRQEIIDAAIDCFVEIGYVRTTTTEIAQMSGYTRGAVQYYFPTTRHVLKASIDYLTKQWLDTYMTAAGNAPPGTDYIDFAVDTLWRFVNDKLFVAWQELVHASRTDKELRKIILPAAAKFEQLRRQMGQANFPDFHEASVGKFQRNRDTLRFVLEGMTSTIVTYDREERIQAQLDWLKEWFHASWAEELASMNGADS